MRTRREVAGALVAFGLAIVPLDGSSAADAQTSKVPRVGVLVPSSHSALSHGVDALRQGLRDLGYITDTDIVLEVRFAEGRVDRFAGLAAELVRLKVDVLVAAGPMIRAAIGATNTIPIVMSGAVDPVAEGFVASLARPGGHVTGISLLAADLADKGLQLLKETVPSAKRVCILWDPADGPSVNVFNGSRSAAAEMGLQFQSLELRSIDDVDRSFETAAIGHCDALVVSASGVTMVHRQRITNLALKYRLPTTQVFREFAEAGGLMSYGPSLSDAFRRAAAYVHKILKGAKPGDLPVEQATKFEMVINLKTAEALGLTIPQSILLRADELIE